MQPHPLEMRRRVMVRWNKPGARERQAAAVKAANEKKKLAQIANGGKAKKGKLLSPASLGLDPNLRCLRVYPVEDTRKKKTENLMSVSISLSQKQMCHLAEVLLAAARSGKWRRGNLTAYRFRKRKSDGTYQLTFTNNNGIA